MTFSQLAVGETFRFSSDFEGYLNIKRGLCKKVARSKYIYPDDEGIYKDLVYTVGTGRVEVVQWDY